MIRHRMPEEKKTPAVMMAPAILRTWEIHPLGMSEFVAHEVQVAFTCEQNAKTAVLVSEKVMVSDVSSG
jgi:hypothetical protein